ncbi:MAG: hypothetical protein EXR98_03850 [Gemmataceae bacterium]|nr:hypothetical protein [Gemmataceae bacterium]
MSVLGLDWNATRVRAVLGASGAYPMPLPLEPPALDLPLAISLEKSVPTVGGFALRQCRTSAHLVCQAFLPHLSEQPGQGPRWQAGRHILDTRDACDLVWRKLSYLGASSQGLVLSVPGYLAPVQVEALRKLGERARLPVLGSAPTILTAALAAYHPSPSKNEGWQRSVLVIDVDDHALTIGWVKALADKAHLLECRVFPTLGLVQWHERLIDALAELFVWHHRRDPRDVPAAEQSLYDQLEPLTDAFVKRQAIQIGVHCPQWFKHLLVHPDQTAQICQAHVRHAAHEVECLLACWPAGESPRSIVVTHQASRLPGLLDALHSMVLPTTTSETKLPQTKMTHYADEDFGDQLMFPEHAEPGGVMVLTPEAPARAAHGLAELFRRGVLPAGHVETIVPLPRSQGSGVRNPGSGVKPHVGHLTPDS